MKLPSICEISLASNAVCRKQLYRIGLVIRFPHIISIDGKEVSNEERQRAHVILINKCLQYYLDVLFGAVSYQRRSCIKIG